MKTPAPDTLPSWGLTRWWWPLVPLSWASLFWQIGARPLQNWDESLLAVNAAEMLRTHDWVVTRYRGQPDLWNTKPPLAIWLQALSLNTFGYSEWAVRIPTSIAAVTLVVLVALFAKRWLGGPLAGLLAGIALLTSKGFVTDHVARTGDYDTLLLLFTTGQVMALFAWLQTQKRRYLLLTGAAIGLAVLTKGVAGLFFLPGFAIELTRRRQLLRLLKQPAAWAAVGLAIGPPAAWYLLRELAAPGYLAAVWQNELVGRLSTALEQVPAPWYTYLLHFVTQQFLLWTPWVVLSAWLIARRPPSRPAHQFLMLIAWSAGIFLVIISAAATKHTWYDAPVYPLLALLLGAGLTLLSHQVSAANSARAAVYVLALALAPSVIGQYIRLNKLYKQRYKDPTLTYGRFLQQPAATPVHHYTLLHTTSDPNTSQFNGPLEFYALASRNTEPADTIEVAYEVEGFPLGRVVLVCGQVAYAALNQTYHLQPLYQADSCGTYRIKSRRK